MTTFAHTSNEEDENTYKGPGQKDNGNTDEDEEKKEEGAGPNAGDYDLGPLGEDFGEGQGVKNKDL